MRKDQKSFLENIVLRALKEEGTDYSDLVILLPTKRSVLYTREYFRRNCEGIIIMPEILTFEDFVLSQCPYEILSREKALAYLHKAFLEIRQKYNFSFEDFLNYSVLLLKDFDLLDQNLVDERQIFSTLDQAETIKRWAEEFGTGDISVGEEGLLGDYFTFWSICRELYTLYKRLLKNSGLAYSGMAYREFYEGFEELKKNIKADKFWICGFNYLSKSQSGILDKLKSAFELQFFWDLDQYYFNRKYHEAGKYFRSYSTYNISSSAGSFFGKDNLPVSRIVSCPNKNSQVKKAADDIVDLISQLDYDKDIRDEKNLIALIPAEESLLSVILESFPEKVRDRNGREIDPAGLLNISIGRPLRESRFYQLLRLIFELQESLEKDQGKIYYKRLKDVLIHPLVRNCLNNNSFPDTLDSEVRKQNKAYIDYEEILRRDKSRILQLLLKKWDRKGSDFSLYGLDLVDHILENFGEIPPDEKIFLSSFKDVFENMKILLEQFFSDLEPKIFRKLFFQLIHQYSIPFSGEPISPVQIIGLLETRALDFKHIFILSCNEGSLPTPRSHDSLFPFDIKAEYGLPTFIDKDASLSYTFYRLFHRAESMNLYFHNSNDRLKGKAGPSRFLLQLEYEFFPDFEYEVRKESIVHFFPEAKKENPEIQKSPEVLEKIRQKLSRKTADGYKGLSPSLLNKYLRDPIAFFKQVVLDIYEPAELEEDFEASTFGTIIHEVLDKLFSPFKNEVIDKSGIETILKNSNLDILLRKEVKIAAGDIETEKGVNLLYLHIAEILIKRYLEVLKDEGEFRLLETERALSHTFTFYHDKLKEEVAVTIYGKADRIDLKDGIIRIVDYKTGWIDKYNIKYSDPESLFKDKKYDKIIQLLIYKYLLIKNRNNSDFLRGLENNQIDSGFYFFRTGKDSFRKLHIPESLEDENAFCIEVERIISTVVYDILDIDKPFCLQEGEIEIAD